MKKQPIHETNWDHLIVLDACRYDRFQKHYKKYFNGNLKKVKSRASATPEWLPKTFSGKRYNYNYISANPYVNKQGLSISDMVTHLDYEWNAESKFTSVHEAWIDEWDKKVGTVRPKKLRKYAENHINGDKNIIHFIQPHRPFISYKGSKEHDWQGRNKMIEEKEDNKKSVKTRFFNKTRPLWSPIFHSLSTTLKERLRRIIGVGNSYSEFANEVGINKVKECYDSDLNMALAESAKLVENLEGKVIITADHGESWGEEGEWGHPIKSKNPVLTNVPWLEVNKVKSNELKNK